MLCLGPQHTHRTLGGVLCRSTFEPRLGNQPVPRLDLRIPETQLCLAWCLDDEAATAAPAAAAGGDALLPPVRRPEQQSVYAFLPLRSYGLRFVLQVRLIPSFAGPTSSGVECLARDGTHAAVCVALWVRLAHPQADWVVPSSREAVDSDNAWNQALRLHIPGAFVQ